MDKEEKEIPERECHILVKSFYVGESTESLNFGVAAVRLMDRITHKDEFMDEVKTQCSTLENLVADGFLQEVLDLFSSHISQPGVSWEQIIMYYGYIFRRQSVSKEQKSLGYQYFLKLIKNSKQLFFYLKLISNFNFDSTEKQKPHFGNGLKRAIIRWYLSKSLSELLMDLWLMPRAYSWTHKDVLKLLHWNIDKLGDDHLEHKMFVQYCMIKDCDTAQQEFLDTYDNVEEVKSSFEVIKHRMMIQPNEKEDYSLLQPIKKLAEDNRYPLMKHCDQIMHRENLQILIQNLVDESLYFLCQETIFIKKIVPVEDEPENEVTKKKNICRCLVEELNRIKDKTNVSAVDILLFKNAYIKAVKIYCEGNQEKRKWLGGEFYPPVKILKPTKSVFRVRQNVKEFPPKKLEEFSPPYLVEVCDQLEQHLLHQAKRGSIATDHPGVIVVCNVTPRMRNYVYTHSGIVVQKKMRGMQAIVLMLYSFCYKASDRSNDGLGDRALVVTNGTHNSAYCPQTDRDLYKHCMSLFNMMKSPKCTLDKSLTSLFINWTKRRDGANTVVLVLEKITPEILQSAQKELANELNNGIKKFVLLGMYCNHECETLTLPYSSRLLALNGFHSRTLSIIQAYIEGRF